MKSLRVLAFGVAIGVLAILGNAPSAEAAGTRHHGATRPAHRGSAPGMRASRTSQIPDNSRRPAPRRQSRAIPRQASHRSPTRIKYGSQAAALESVHSDPQMFAWRIGASQLISHNNLDDHVISGRGPPRAGPLYAFLAFPQNAAGILAPFPSNWSSSFFETPLHNPSKTQFKTSLAEGLLGPPRAVRNEGSAARLHSPSRGEFV